jgi:uncharacterized protein YuzE
MAKRIDPLTIGPYAFDFADYDAKGDVLYLGIGPPRPAANGEETPEGHVLRWDAHGELIGLTIVNARWYLERDGKLVVTLPVPERVEAPAAVAELVA